MTACGIILNLSRNKSAASVLSFFNGIEIMKLIDRIAEDCPLRYAFAGLAILLMFGMVMT